MRAIRGSIAVAGLALAARAGGYTGTMGAGTPIHLRLDAVPGEAGKLEGSYFYDKLGKPIALSGTVSSAGDVDVVERSGDAVTGRFKGRLDGGHLSSVTWSSPDGKKTLPVTLQPVMVGVAFDIAAKKVDAKGLLHASTYPQVKGLPPAVANAINKTIRETAANGCDAGESAYDAAIVYADRGVLSIRSFASWTCEGAAHPDAGPGSLNFLLATGEAWDPIGDLADQDAFRELCGKAIAAASPHAKDPDACDSDGYAESITVAPDGLVIEGFYPHVCGAFDDFSVWLPWAKVRPFCKPGSELAKLAGS